MAFPGSLTYKRGVKDTDDVISQEKPLAIGDKIWMHDPTTNKVLGWILARQDSEPVYNHIFGHLEDAPFQNWVKFVGTTESSQGATGLVLDTGHGARVTTGSRIFWPRTEEIIRLTAAMSTDTTGAVARNFGRGNASTSLLAKGDYGLIITPAFEQGFTTGSGQSNSMAYKTFATTEISYPVSTTYVERAERSRGGDPFIRALNKAMKQSKDQMHGELLYGAYSSDDDTYTHPISTSQGLDNWISSYQYSANRISRLDMWDILLTWNTINKNGGLILCSTFMKARIAQWALERTEYLQGTEEDGITIERVKTPVGTFDIMEDDLLDQNEILAGMMYGIPNPGADGPRVQYHPLVENLNLDIRYNPISRDEVHSDEGEIYGVYGWEFFEEEMFWKVTGLDLAA